MGENTRRRVASDDPEMQPWMSVFVKFGSATAHYALIVGGLALLVTLGAIALGKTAFPWLTNVQSAVALFLLIGFIALFFKYHESLAPGWFGLVFGFGFFIGSPFLLGFLANYGKLKMDDAFIMQVMSSFKNLGFFLLVVAVIRLLIGFYQYFTGQRHATVQRFQYMDTSKEDATHISLIPKCWQMSRCRPAVRMSCPNYLDRKTCWSRRSGCFCDRDLANYLLQSVDKNETTEVTDVQAVAATRGPAPRGAGRPWKLQKALCYNCPVFIEHQEYKFKHLRWVSLPMTLAIGGALWVPFDMGFNWFSNWLLEFTKKLVALGNLPENFRPDVTNLGSGFEIFLGVVFLVLISSWVMEFTERMFLKWNL